ncbi:hypothetical protein pb186bvf_007327 [Paramecium bursaria]
MSNLIQSIFPRSQEDLWSIGMPKINMTQTVRVQENDNLFIKDRHGNLKLKNHYFLFQQYIITSKNHIDLLFTEFKVTKVQDHYVLQIMKNREIFQLFSNKKLINEWAIHIKKYSFQTDFDEKYILSKYQKPSQTNNNLFLASNIVSQEQIFVKQFEKMDQFKIDNLEILQKIHNQNIQQLIGMYKNQEYIQLILECRKGKKLDKTQFVEQEIIKILISLLKLVNELHEQKIVHRNINFNTVLLDNQDIFIQGLENARYVSRVDPFQNDSGFTAPELMMGQQYNEKIDIYAIGALVYFMLTQKFPYLIKSNILIFNELEFHKIESQPFLKSLVRQLLNIDPNQRLSASEALNHRCFLETTKTYWKKKIKKGNLLESCQKIIK